MMATFGLRSALAVLAPLVVCGPVSAGTVSFFDGTFDPASWTVTVLQGGSYSVTQIASGGDPGPYQQVVLESGPYYNDIEIMSGFAYTPSTQGAITSLTMSLSAMDPGGPAQGDGLFIKQGSSWWMAGYGTTTGSWQTFSTGVTTASDWTTGVPGGTPDFSSTGGTITFGYLAANTDSFSTAGIDNFSVTIDSVPEPVSLALLGVGVLGTLCTRRRAKRARG
jgi:hypothetical protein